MLINELQRTAAAYGCSLQEKPGEQRLLIYRDSRYLGQIVEREVYQKGGESIDDGLKEKISSILEMYDAFGNAPPLAADGLDEREGYRLLAEYRNTVLAMKDSDTFRPECVTWERTPDGNELFQGHYFADNYDAAKKDFAVRSGLISQDELFSKEELAAISHAIDCVQEVGGFDDMDTEAEMNRLNEKLYLLAPELFKPQEAAPSQQL